MRSKEQHKLWKREYRNTVAGRAGSLLGSAKRRSKEKGLTLSITKEWVIGRLSTGVCELTKLPFDLLATGRINRNPNSPSIDRIDSSLGYTPENCRLVLLSVNDALNQYGLEHFLKVAEAIIKQNKENCHGRLQIN